MAGDEAVEVAAGQAETGEVVPAAHIFAGRWEASHLAKDFEQAVVVQVQKDGMISSNARFIGPARSSTSE